MIVSSHLETGFSTVGSTLHVTGTYSPSSGRLILFSLASTFAVAVTIEGNGATWVLVNDVAAGVNPRLVVFRAMSTGALLSGASTIRLGGVVPQAPLEWSITQFSGVSTDSTDGAGAVVQTSQGVGSTNASTVSVTLAPFTASGNVAYGAFAQISTSLMTTRNGFSLLASTFGETLGGRSALLVEEKLNETIVEASGVATAGKSAIGIEIKESTVSEQRFRRLMVNVGR